MNPILLIDTLAKLGIKLEVVGGNTLKYYPKSLVPPTILELLKNHKQSLIETLSKTSPKSPKFPSAPTTEACEAETCPPTNTPCPSASPPDADAAPAPRPADPEAPAVDPAVSAFYPDGVPAPLNDAVTAVLDILWQNGATLTAFDSPDCATVSCPRCGCQRAIEVREQADAAIVSLRCSCGPTWFLQRFRHVKAVIEYAPAPLRRW
jgi:hypothetical protein